MRPVVAKDEEEREMLRKHREAETQAPRKTYRFTRPYSGALITGVPPQVVELTDKEAAHPLNKGVIEPCKAAKKVGADKGY